MRKHFIWQKPKENAETIFKTYELCFYGGINYIYLKK